LRDLHAKSSVRWIGLKLCWKCKAPPSAQAATERRASIARNSIYAARN
jgi:hypothetical protein